MDVALEHPDEFNVKKASLSARWKRIDNFTVCKKIEELISDDDQDSVDFDEKNGEKLKEYFDKLLDKKVRALVEGLSDGAAEWFKFENYHLNDAGKQSLVPRICITY